MVLAAVVQSSDPQVSVIYGLPSAIWVCPPEEEQFENPPWCYYGPNACSSPRSSTSTEPTLDVQMQVGSPVDHDASKDTSYADESWWNVDMDTGEDVIEVVKVGRRKSEGTNAKPTESRPSKSLRERASKALRSIKNVGRSGNRTPKASAKHRPADTENNPIPPRSVSPAPSHRSFRSRLRSSSIRNRSSIDTDEAPVSELAYTLPMPEQASPYLHDELNGTVTSLDTPTLSGSSPSIQIPDVHSLSTARPERRRISIRDLRGLFNFSSTTSPHQPTGTDELAEAATAKDALPSLGQGEYTSSDAERTAELELASLHFDANISFDAEEFRLDGP